MKVLITAQLGNAVVGIIQTVLVARWLGPGFLGMVATIGGFGAVTFSFVDVRVSDISGRLVNKDLGSVSKSAVVFAGGFLQCVLGILGWVTSFMMAVICQKYFLAEVFPLSSIALLCAAPSCSFVSNFFQYVQRFGAAPGRVAIFQFAISMITTLILLLLLGFEGPVLAYPFALCISSAFGLIMHCVFCILAFGISVRRSELISGLRCYWEERRLIFATNLLGYVKMLHRGPEVLLVAFVGSASVTGLYTLARSLSDALFLAIDVLQRQFQPVLYEDIGRGSFELLRRLANIMGVTLVVSLFLLPLLLLPLRAALPLIFGQAYADAAPLIALLAIPQLLSASINLWLWPFVLMTNKVGQFTRIFFLSVLAIEYCLALPIAKFLIVDPFNAVCVLIAGIVAVFATSYLQMIRTLAKTQELRLL